MGLIVGLSVGTAASFALTGLPVEAEAVTLIGCALGVAWLGLTDDRRGLSPRLRLTVQIALSAAFVAVVGPVDVGHLFASVGLAPSAQAVAFAGTVIWMVAVTNFYNFMDGVDGLATGQAIASCAGVIVAGWSAPATAVAYSLGGAALGFLPFNWPPAKIFLGDVGSGSVGFLLGGLPLLAPPESRVAALVATATGLTFFILDPSFTLVRRILKRQPLMQSHREHLYQRLMPVGSTSRLPTRLLVGAGCLLSIVAAIAYPDAGSATLVIVVAGFLFGIEVVAVTRTRRRRKDTTHRLENSHTG